MSDESQALLNAATTVGVSNLKIMDNASNMDGYTYSMCSCAGEYLVLPEEQVIGHIDQVCRTIKHGFVNEAKRDLPPTLNRAPHCIWEPTQRVMSLEEAALCSTAL